MSELTTEQKICGCGKVAADVAHELTRFQAWLEATSEIPIPDDPKIRKIVESAGDEVTEAYLNRILERLSAAQHECGINMEPIKDTLLTGKTVATAVEQTRFDFMHTLRQCAGMLGPWQAIKGEVGE